MKKKKKKQKAQEHPTLFSLEGSIRHYEQGSMLQLYSLITNEEWEAIVEETVKYSVFVSCLKEVAFPILKEQWTEEDEWFKLQLELAISRMRNIDAMLLLKYDENKLKEEYSSKMRTNGIELMKIIEEMKLQRNDITTKVSNL